MDRYQIQTGVSQKPYLPVRVQSLSDRARCLIFERFTLHKYRSQWHNQSGLFLRACTDNIDLEALRAVAGKSNHSLLGVSLRSDDPYPKLQIRSSIPLYFFFGTLANGYHRYGRVSKLTFVGLWHSIFPGQARHPRDTLLHRRYHQIIHRSSHVPPH